VFIQSRSQAGKKVSHIHRDLFNQTTLEFSAELNWQVDVIFLCLGHGESEKFISENKVPSNVKIIDLSQDFRLQNAAGRKFVYGLPEFNRSKIKQMHNVANPGCFATAIQLCLLPLASNMKLQKEIHVTGITGSTGAGQTLSATTHFTWRSSNVSVYKPLVHQHLAEIKQTLSVLQKAKVDSISFIPLRGNFTRGILVTAYTKVDWSLEKAVENYHNFYANHPFVSITDENPDLKQVVNTNNALLYLAKEQEKLLIIGAIDNLIKGASGQAVQNMNLMFGLDETSGLNLKPVAF
jgi:N-acetyl-gamma-glutamyl-phosphate reductase